MATEVILPKVDMVMETGTFLEWLKHEGDSVIKGEPLFVISTDKAAMEIESPATGVLSDLRAKRDDVIPVTTTLAFILEPGERLPGKTSASPNAPDAASGRPGVEPAPQPLGAVKAEMSPGPGNGNGRTRATPIARRMAAELGLDLGTIAGRGPGGRVHKADVLDAAAKRAAPAVQVASQQVAAAIPAPASPALVALSVPLPDARRKQVVPLTGPRKIIAERMAYSASVAPHITLSLEVDMSEAARMRSRVQAQFEKTGHSLSYTAIIARAAAAVLVRHPYMNASLAGENIILWEDVHLGIATSLDDYLIVPVIRQAQNKNLEQIVATLHDLVERARTRRLTPAEMSGSTFTISNLGMFGIESFTAIINPPESAILAVGKIVDRPVVAGEGRALRPMMNLTVSADHRVVDGVAAARFLDDLKTTLENPYLLI